jgi:hypothetical protein
LFEIFKNVVSFNMESFKYNVYEWESLFSESYHLWHGFFTRVPPFNALPGMFLTLYSSTDIKNCIFMYQQLPENKMATEITISRHLYYSGLSLVIPYLRILLVVRVLALIRHLLTMDDKKQFVK